MKVTLKAIIIQSFIWTITAFNKADIKFRSGSKLDELQISLTMAKNLMNPLGIDSKNFVVAIDSTNRKLMGWAQIRPIGQKIRDPDVYNAQPGSGSKEKEISDDIWDEFENDNIEFPNGFKSLPWTREYREFSQASARRRERRQMLEEKAMRDNESGQNQAWELASVYVLPEWRNRGIGSELVRRIMARHCMLNRKTNDVYLLTLESTKEWYQRLGFDLTDDTPLSMSLEIAAGGILTNFLGEKLIAMQGGRK